MQADSGPLASALPTLYEKLLYAVSISCTYTDTYLTKPDYTLLSPAHPNSPTLYVKLLHAVSMSCTAHCRYVLSPVTAATWLRAKAHFVR
jgi:hypothetical protein